MIHPYMPKYSEKVLSFFGKTIINGRIGKPSAEGSLSWENLGITEGLSTVSGNEIIFTPMDNPAREAYRSRYAGSQQEKKRHRKTQVKRKKWKKKKKKNRMLKKENR